MNIKEEFEKDIKDCNRLIEFSRNFSFTHEKVDTITKLLTTKAKIIKAYKSICREDLNEKEWARFLLSAP